VLSAKIDYQYEIYRLGKRQQHDILVRRGLYARQYPWTFEYTGKFNPRQACQQGSNRLVEQYVRTSDPYTYVQRTFFFYPTSPDLPLTNATPVPRVFAQANEPSNDGDHRYRPQIQPQLNAPV
jgi:hypothetical protein